MEVKDFVSEGVGKYVNHLFSIFLKEEDITHNFTAPHTPQKISISERGNRTTNEKERTMLHRASMPTYMWGTAVLSAVYLKNRTVSKACGGITPFESLTGEHSLRWTYTDFRMLSLLAYCSWNRWKICSTCREKISSQVC